MKSPFALSPSVRPPVSGVRISVDAPAPLAAGPELPLSQRTSDVDPIEAAPDSARAATVLPPPEAAVPTVHVPRAPAKKRRNVLPFVAIGGVLVLAASGVVAWRLLADKPVPPAAVSPRVAQFVDEPAPAPPASAPPAPRAFDREAARAALDAAQSSLTECKLPKGKAVRVKTTFTSSGSIASASALPPITAKQASCVSRKLDGVRVPEFDGAPASYVHTFVAR